MKSALRCECKHFQIVCNCKSIDATKLYEGKYQLPYHFGNYWHFSYTKSLFPFCDLPAVLSKWIIVSILAWNYSPWILAGRLHNSAERPRLTASLMMRHYRQMKHGHKGDENNEYRGTSSVNELISICCCTACHIILVLHSDALCWLPWARCK